MCVCVCVCVCVLSISTLEVCNFSGFFKKTPFGKKLGIDKSIKKRKLVEYKRYIYDILLKSTIAMNFIFIGYAGVYTRILTMH